MTTNRLFKYVVIPIVMLLVCMTYFTPLDISVKLVIRIFFILLFFAVWRFFSIRNIPEGRDLAFVFLVLNLAFLIVMPFTSDFWNLSQETPRGIALIKLSDSLIVSFVLIASFLLARKNLKSIFLTRGKFIIGALTGIMFFLVFGYLALNNPQQMPAEGFVSKNWMWILVFVFSNGFMEELVFRGVILERLGRYFKPFLSILITSICFAVPHLVVSYQPNVFLFTGIVFILGMICGYAMQLTKSIIAPTLIHAGADLMIIIPIFAMYGVNG